MSSTASLSPAYRALTRACGFVDRSERGKLALTGGEAKRFLQGQVTNDVESLTPGTGCYAAFLTPKGKMLGDVRILDTGSELLLDTERGALQGLFNMIQRFSIGYDVQLHKRTLERGLISLIGPEATTVAGVLADDPEDTHMAGSVSGIPVRTIRTDLGVDLLCDAADTDRLSSALREAGVTRVDDSAVECLRVERGRPRYGIDLDETVIPQEAGLNERAVSFTKGCYVGQETVARLHYRGKPNRHLRGLRLAGPAASGDPIRFGERDAGQVGTVAESPRFGWIALALIRREAAPGSTVSVGSRPAEVVELPFA